jgi:phosphatidylinositol-3,4,5-trisphosphate 3-phosphatase and dual-specificity protein phosphatase PTEN
MLQKKIRKLVSKKKNRYEEDGYDLDLTCNIISYKILDITPNIIAMGFPSVSVEGLFRNKMSEVQKLLESKHNSCYKVYNLCSEKSYEKVHFKGRVERYPFVKLKNNKRT